MVERRATIKEVEGLGLGPNPKPCSRLLHFRCYDLPTTEHQVLGDVICPLFTGVAQKIFFVPLPFKNISKRKLAINQKVN